MRVKRGVTKRKSHKKVLELVKGYRMKRSKLISVAYEAMHHAGNYAFNGRRKKKGDMRSLWIQRINAALDGRMSYSHFVHEMKVKNVELNRKVLADLATNDINAFNAVYETVAK